MARRGTVRVIQRTRARGITAWALRRMGVAIDSVPNDPHPSAARIRISTAHVEKVGDVIIVSRIPCEAIA